ncbi:DUF3820 family protein [Marinibactrum halimedae]|uniref:DUF3820 family protein n=1 Tax=Marinibactrum halimedae TaxID=1444977 RepID=A0AA37T3D3_9GAMM|nr:DUF3820 family protein [Marinibactrum halimedae]MCD9457926.1 DUF3820 family protein [Marinibactrum halimedae]GLS26249.1 hypothetical protein GCM10007877_19640 [Marinibactrum halimedae]
MNNTPNDHDYTDATLFDTELLIELANKVMPFGKYEGRTLIDLPEPYVLWLMNHAPPKGRLGDLMALLHTVKVNGLEPLIEPLRNT